MVVERNQPALVAGSERLCGSDEEHLCERDQLAEDEPDVDVLHVGRLGQGLHHGDENCCQDQHVGQVHSQSRLNDIVYVSFAKYCQSSLQSTRL